MALDIHWALQEIYDYFYNNHDEFESFDGNEYPINAYAHAVFERGDKDNAKHVVFASGYETFFFGDGYSYFNPLASLDVVSHEYGHAITYNFTGLTSDGDVQSAINEGFSDIWGAVIENAVAPNKDCWKIGEEVINIAGYDCLRNLETSESATAKVQIADTYGDNTYSIGNYYAKSGIMSHWFYLLSEGGTDTNDNDDVYTVCGIGIDNAAKIVFEGQTGHFGSVSSYYEARTAMVDASDAIYGEDSWGSIQVKNAWYAVGIGNKPSQATISGPSLLCSSGTFSVSNLPTFDSIIWECSPNLTISSGQNTNSCSISIAGNGSSWVGARLVTNCGEINLPHKTVWAGIQADFSGPSSILVGGSGTYTASITTCENSSSPITYRWWLREMDTGQASTVIGYGNPITLKSFSRSYSKLSADVSLRQPVTSTYYYLSLSVIDQYGSYTTDEQLIRAYGDVDLLPISPISFTKASTIYLSTSPNPVNTEAIISLETTNKGAAIEDNKEWTLDIYSSNQSLKDQKHQIKGKECRINTSGWDEGIYILRANYNNEIITGKLIVNNK